MSKKMMKRSLALGALMAFVITGQAWAASGVISEKIVDGSIAGTGALEVTVGGEQQGLQLGDSKGTVSEKVTISGFDSIVLDGSNSKDKNSFNAYKQTSISFENIGSVYSAEDSNLNNTIVFHAQGGNINIGSSDNAIGDIKLVNVSTGFIAQEGGVLTVYAGDINVLASNDNGVQAQSNNSGTGIDTSRITLNGNNITIKAEKKDSSLAGISNWQNANGSITVNAANKLSITGSNAVNANTGAVSLNAADIYIAENRNGVGNALRGANGATLNVTGVNAKGESKIVIDGNIKAESSAKINLDADDVTINGTVRVEASEAGSNVTLKGENITIDAKGGRGVNVVNGTAVDVAGSGSVILGSDGTEEINIKNASIGICVQYNGTAAAVEVNGSKLNITDSQYGIWAMNGNLTDSNANDNAKIVIGKGTSTNIETNYYGIVNTSQALVDVAGDLVVKAPYAIMTRGDAETNINVNGGNLVQITGDILFGDGTRTETDYIDAELNLNLDKEGSYFEGSIYTADINDVRTDRGSEVTGMNITLKNGATWNLTGASIVNQATFGKDSVLNIVDGTAFEKQKDSSKDVFALNGAVNGNPVNALKTEVGAKIVIGKGEVGKTYNIASGFGGTSGFDWELKADNALWYVEWNRDNEITNSEGLLYHPLYGTIKARTGESLVESGVATNENKEILSAVAGANKGVNPTADAINALATNENVTKEDIKKGAVALLQIGEAGGFTGNVVSVSKQVTGTVGARNSFSGPKHSGPRHRGGHGPSLVNENDGGAVWAQYVHGKDKVDGIDMGGVENAYESQFNGVVLGMDFKQVGSYASGITFNYGEGDSHSKKNVVQSDSEFDFWGVGYYGAVKKQDTNFIFDIGYSESDSDVEQAVGNDKITANPEASTWTAGVKVEKLIDKGAVQIVPYAGLRYMSIDTDEYKATGSTDTVTYYSTERQNIWLLPIGVSMSQENVYDSGWIVTPKADFSYTWAMGDTDSSMTVNMPNVGSETLGYTVMDDGSFMATIGLDAQKEDWTFGVAYSYQKGDSTRSDRWYVNARYSF